MKLKPRTFQIFWDVHAWAGIAGALLLYVMFFAGAFALFRQEIDVWADPGVTSHANAGALPPLQPLLEQLATQQDIAGKPYVAFVPSSMGLRAEVAGEDDARRNFYLSPITGRLEPVRSELGTFLYSLHYLEPIPFGIYVAGVASMALLLALVTGAAIHLKDLVRQWFQFRAVRARRTWSSDLHKLLGVLGLPYQLFYAWSGVVLALSWNTVDPLFRAVVFGGDERAASIARGEPVEIEATGELTAALPDLDVLVGRARRRVPGLEPTWVGLFHPRDEASTMRVYGDVVGTPFGTTEVVLRARDGAVLAAYGPSDASAFQRFIAWFYGLHYARFGDYGIRCLYALLALATCAVIVSGNVVWLERRDRARAHRGNRVLERATAGICAGLPMAVGGAFLLNRVVSAAASRQPTIEHGGFCALWLIAVLAAFAARSARFAAACELMVACALFVAAVLVDVTLRSSAFADPYHRAIAVALALCGATCGVTGLSLLRARRAMSVQLPKSDTARSEVAAE